MQNKMSLSKRARNFGLGREKSAVYGLKLAIEVIEHMANHRDWDAAANLLGGLKSEPPMQVTVKRMIRLRFGDNIKIKSAGAKHTSGFEFTWQTKDPVVAPNSWAMILDAAAANQAITSKQFKDTLKTALGEDKDEDEAKPAFDQEKKAKELLAKLRKEGVNVDAFFAEVKRQDMLKRGVQVQAVPGTQTGASKVVTSEKKEARELLIERAA